LGAPPLLALSGNQTQTAQSQSRTDLFANPDGTFGPCHETNGFGSGLQAALERHGADVVGHMAAQWPFFGHLLDDVEAMLARTDLEIAGHYDALAGAALRTQAEFIRKEFALTEAHVLRLRGTAALLDGNPTLQRSIKLRNPYIDPMHLMQVDLLRRWRATQRQDQGLFGALRATIGGIAQGLEATG